MSKLHKQIKSLGFILLMNTSVYSATFYISPTGNDTTGTGSPSTPWKTVEKARDHLRTLISSGLTEGVTVYLAPGTYVLDATLEFNNQDSPDSPYCITYAGQSSAGTAIIKSASVITNSGGWTYYTNGIWRINIGTGQDIDTMYEGDIRAIEARYPNRGANTLYPQARAPYLVSTGGDILASNTNRSWVSYSSGDFIPEITNAEHIVLFPWGTDNWHLWSCDITSCSTNYSRIYFNNDGDQTTIGSMVRYFVSGALELLDAPGEFYYNSSQCYLYYKPLTPGNPANKYVSVPSLKTLISITGTSNTSTVRGLKFKRLVFADTAAVVPARQWWTFDWGKTDYGIIKMQNTGGIQFDECQIKNSGRHGILAVGHNEQLIVNNSMIENVGVSGIVLCNRFVGTSDRIQDCIISNCVVQNVGNLSLYAGCIEMMNTESCLVDHCGLYDSARYAVTLRGNCLDGGGAFNSFPKSDQNIIRNCWMERCSQDGGDSGVLHMAGITDGTMPYTNFFENIVIANTQSVLGQNDTALPAGLYTDWPGATKYQSFKNIWIEFTEGKDFKPHENLIQICNNVSWEDDFNLNLINTENIGPSALPEGFGFVAPSSGIGKDIIIDNYDPEYTETGVWSDSDYGRRKQVWSDETNHGSRYSINRPGIAKWTPDITYPGYYDVYVWLYQYASEATTGVVYTVVSDKSSCDFIVNQRSGPYYSWKLLDTFYFDAGTNGYIQLDAGTAEYNGQVRADAVRFVKNDSLWQDNFERGYTAGGTDLIGQNSWAIWSGASPDVVTDSNTVLLQGVSTDDARAKRSLNSSFDTNRNVTIQISCSIPDTTSTVLSRTHAGLGSYSANAVGVNVGIDATGIFFSSNGIASSSFVYGYVQGTRFVPASQTVYTLKAVMDLETKKAKLFVSTDGTRFQQMSFNATETTWETPFDAGQASSWNAVYLRMGTHTSCKIYDMAIKN